jgi:hypothetical protein
MSLTAQVGLAGVSSLEGVVDLGSDGFSDGQALEHRRKRRNIRPRLLRGGPVRHFLDESVEPRRVFKQDVGKA